MRRGAAVVRGGYGINYAFDPNSVGAGQIDFVGVSMHEVSEIMGRIAGIGANFGNGIPDYMLYDLFRYTGAGARALVDANGVQFSINNGTTLLKGFNFSGANGGDSADWASGANDSFNAFSSSSVQNPMTAVDLRAMDVIGYDRVSAAVPEPSTAILLFSALLAGGFLRRK